MRKLLLIAVVGIGILALLRRALPADQRVRWQEHLSGVPGVMMERGTLRKTARAGDRGSSQVKKRDELRMCGRLP